MADNAEIDDEFIEELVARHTNTVDRELKKNKTIGESVAEATRETRHTLLELKAKWERAARIDELKSIGGVNDSYESIGHLKSRNVKERISELAQLTQEEA